MVETAYRGTNYWAAMIIGWTLVVVGLLGFVWDPVLFVFDTGPLHNVVHLLTGGVLLIGAYAANGAYARQINLTLGIVYALVAILGFATPALMQSIIDYGYDNTNNVFLIWDNWLHTLLAVGLIAVSFADRETRMERRTGTQI